MNAPHPLIAAYMNRHRLPAGAVHDGVLTLRVNGRFRVHVHPARPDSVVLLAQVAHLPAERGERDRLVDRALRLGAARLQRYRSAIVCDRYTEALWLQQRYVEGEGDTSFEQCLVLFGADLAAWTDALGH